MGMGIGGDPVVLKPQKRTKKSKTTRISELCIAGALQSFLTHLENQLFYIYFAFILLFVATYKLLIRSFLLLSYHFVTTSVVKKRIDQHLHCSTELDLGCLFGSKALCF